MCAHKRNLDLERLNHVTDEEVTALHMLHAVMMLRVIGDVPSALGVSIKGSRSRLTFPDALNKFPKVNDVLRSL